MKCPNCGRFSKLKHNKRGEGVEMVSVCSNCGEINLPEDKPIEKTDTSFQSLNLPADKLIEKIGSYFENLKIILNARARDLQIILIIATIIFAGASFFLYFKYEEGLDVIASLEENLLSLDAQYSELADNYVILLNNSETLRDFYTSTLSNYNELQLMYQELRQEYSGLQVLHSSNIQDNAMLLDRISQLNIEKEAIQKELDDTLSFSKSMIIEDNSSYVILPGGNMTLSYDIVFAGYIEVNFTSTADVYIWIGSPVSEDVYYSRFPVFPRTAYNGTFTVPVSNRVFLFIENTDMVESGEITMTIKYTY